MNTNQIQHATEIITENIIKAAADDDRPALAVLAEADIHAELQACGMSADEASANCTEVRKRIAARIVELIG